jgi:hypothetical protein
MSCHSGRGVRADWRCPCPERCPRGRATGFGIVPQNVGLPVLVVDSYEVRCTAATTVPRSASAWQAATLLTDIRLPQTLTVELLRSTYEAFQSR